MQVFPPDAKSHCLQLFAYFYSLKHPFIQVIFSAMFIAISTAILSRLLKFVRVNQLRFLLRFESGSVAGNFTILPTVYNNNKACIPAVRQNPCSFNHISWKTWGGLYQIALSWLDEREFFLCILKFQHADWLRSFQLKPNSAECWVHKVELELAGVVDNKLHF